jgi:hypothetical protein
MSRAHPTDPAAIADLLDRTETCLDLWAELTEHGTVSHAEDIKVLEDGAADLVEEAFPYDAYGWEAGVPVGGALLAPKLAHLKVMTAPRPSQAPAGKVTWH